MITLQALAQDVCVPRPERPFIAYLPDDVVASTWRLLVHELPMTGAGQGRMDTPPLLVKSRSGRYWGANTRRLGIH